MNFAKSYFLSEHMAADRALLASNDLEDLNV